jgi:hypothetical protein
VLAVDDFVAKRAAELRIAYFVGDLLRGDGCDSGAVFNQHFRGAAGLAVLAREKERNW